MGNYLLQKVAHKIVMVPCGAEHLVLAASGGGAALYPVALKPEHLERCGFAENMKYGLRPQAREFSLVLPVMGTGNNEIKAYVKSNGECFAYATANGATVSNNVYQLHQLQNLFYALTGGELLIKP